MSAFEQLAAIINLIKIVKPGGEETRENIHSTTFIKSLRKCVGKTNERNLTCYFGFFKNGEEKKQRGNLRLEYAKCHTVYKGALIVEA